jgi:hypothetical protein
MRREGREEAMSVVHTVAESPRHEVAPAIEALDDPKPRPRGCARAHRWRARSRRLRDGVAEAEGGETLPPHQATKIIGEGARRARLTSVDGTAALACQSGKPGGDAPESALEPGLGCSTDSIAC